MNTRQWITTLALILLCTTQALAQVSREIKSFRNQPGVTVTMLTPSLYNLYTDTNAPLEAEEALRNITAINILHLDRQAAEPQLLTRVEEGILPLLADESRYTLVSSDEGIYSQQRIYALLRDQDVTGLVVWHLTPDALAVVELKGQLTLSRLPDIARVLNVKGIQALATIGAPTNQEPGTGPEAWLQTLKQHFGIHPDSLAGHIGHLLPSTDSLGNMFGNMDDILQRLEQIFGDMGSSLGFPDDFPGGFDTFPPIDSLFGFPGQFPGNTRSYSNGLQIIRENGKTRIQVDAQNVDIRYLIDGIPYAPDSIPEGALDNIATATMVPDPDIPHLTHVVINTLIPAGHFISYSDGILKYNYHKQEYTINVDKLADPALLVDGRLARYLDVDPSRLVQIRPATDAERRLLGLPNLQAVLVTKVSSSPFPW